MTDRAIVDVVSRYRPGTVLDIGCGEGWLARALAAQGIRVTGVDAVTELIERAREAGGGEFEVLTYESIAAGEFRHHADAVVCNFSLIGKQATEDLCHAVPGMLEPQGVFIVQTLHPLAACGDHAYHEAWREGSWDGCGDDFRDPAPWYFRTLEGWLHLLRASGLRLLELREPPHPDSGRPASLILVAEAAAAARTP